MTDMEFLISEMVAAAAFAVWCITVVALCIGFSS